MANAVTFRSPYALGSPPEMHIYFEDEPGNPRLDQAARRAHAASHHDAWPGSGGALPVLPLTAGSLISLRHRGARVSRQIVRVCQVTQ